MLQSHKRSIKPFSADFWDDFVQLKSFSRIFQSTESQFKNSYQFRLRTSRNCSSPEDDFRQLVSSDHLFRFTKMTFRHHQITEDDFPGPSWFRLSWDGIGQAPVSHLPWFDDAGRWLNGACPILACRKPELARPRHVIFCDLVTPEDDKPELLKPSYKICKIL